MRPLLLLWLVLTLAVALLPGASQAQVFDRFYVDSNRSFIAFDAGELSGQLGTSLFPFAALTSQPGVTPVPLAGEFVLQITPDRTAPSALTVVVGSTDIRAADGNLVSPGAGGEVGMVDAAFGLTFDDSAAGVSGDIAIHDLIYALEGSFDVFANGVGPLGLRGSLAWNQVRGSLEIRTDIGLTGLLPAPPVLSSDGFLFSSTSQFAEVSAGIYEVVLPFGFTVGAFDLPGPVTFLATSMSFSGELVATTDAPEPGFGLALVLGAGLLSRLGRIRSPR